MKAPSALYVWHILATTIPFLCSALTIRNIEPSPKNAAPAVGVRFFFDTSGTMTEDDPDLIDILVRDTVRRNDTLIFGRHNISQDADAGFELPDFPPGPGYIIRMVDTANPQKVLADSATFQIYPPGTPPFSIDSTETSTNPSTASSANSGVPSDTANVKAPLPIGTIVGGAVGGFVILVLFAILLYFLLRTRKTKPPPTIQGAPPTDKAGPLISPFIIPTGNPCNETIPLTPSSGAQTSRVDYNSSATEKARLRAQQSAKDIYSGSGSSRGHGTTSSDATPSTVGSSEHLLMRSTPPQSSSGDSRTVTHSRKGSTSKVAARAEQLRRERERIDREIAELEQQGGNESTNRQGDDVLGQIAMLREQATRMGHVRTQTPDEPPPEYVPR